MKSFLASVALATVIVGFAPQTAFADGWRFQGSFAVAYSATANTGGVSYCGGPARTGKTEAHGNGYTSLGAMAFTLLKTGGGGAFHGCLTLIASNGDILEATYVGSAAAANPNNFSPAAGTLTFTGGTGRFKGASGSGTWTAIFDTFYIASSFAGGGPAVPIQGMAFYDIAGTIRRDKH